MPTKYRPSAMRVDRATKKVEIEHFYVKQISKTEAFKMLNDHNVSPKVKRKLRNELVRRGIEIIYVPKTVGNV
jgi:ribosomal protein L10|tara:strand:- start:106 stop:324 length:219 start_codon:yes stop_codon:yes gene_type:complete